MNSFSPASLCVLGRQPELGMAELESLYGAEHVRPFGGCALLDVVAEEIDFRRLGGTVKVARVLSGEAGNNWPQIENYLSRTIPEHLAKMPEGKFTLGMSVYGLKATAAEINKSLLKIKKALKPSGRPVRVVPNKAPFLSSAQVLHNGLTRRGAWELIAASDSRETLLAQTLFVQDIEAYGARDQARPARDARVGMLPPKLAQIMINLAIGNIENSEIKDPRSKIRILDPFCGTGVVLQEALLMGFSVLGTDLEPRMVEYTKKNLAWLVEKHPEITSFVSVEKADATEANWATFTAVVAETYLGRPLNSLPPPDKLKEITTDVNTILTKFLKNLGSQLKADRRVCLAVPAWRKPGGGFVHLPLIDRLDALGYNKVDFTAVGSAGLVYFRENQTVARQLLVLTKQ